MTMTQEIISQLKENGQDFEWYPTTVEMIETVSRKCASIYHDIGFSLLDIVRPSFVNIGADSKGHGLIEPSAEKVLALIDGITKTGIEIRQKTNLERILNR